MEIYAYTLQSNITTDVKKKRGGDRSQLKPSTPTQHQTSQRNITTNLTNAERQRAKRNMETYTATLHCNIISLGDLFSDKHYRCVSESFNQLIKKSLSEPRRVERERVMQGQTFFFL
jgi:hypothetical protein